MIPHCSSSPYCSLVLALNLPQEWWCQTVLFTAGSMHVLPGFQVNPAALTTFSLQIYDLFFVVKVVDFQCFTVVFALVCEFHFSSSLGLQEFELAWILTYILLIIRSDLVCSLSYPQALDAPFVLLSVVSISISQDTRCFSMYLVR